MHLTEQSSASSTPFEKGIFLLKGDEFLNLIRAPEALLSMKERTRRDDGSGWNGEKGSSDRQTEGICAGLSLA